MSLFGRRKQARLEKTEDEARFFARRRYLREDVTVFGEELSELHVDTLTDVLDEDARDYYRYALESYDRAKRALADAQSPADLDAAVTAVIDGRHQHACVVALVAGEATPPKLEECFFNPQHGPSGARMRWTPPGGVEREVAVCAADAQRLRVGEQPKSRLVRVGDRHVPLYAAGDPIGGYFPPMMDAEAIRDGIRLSQDRAALHGWYSDNGVGGIGARRRWRWRRRRRRGRGRRVAGPES